MAIMRAAGMVIQRRMDTHKRMDTITRAVGMAMQNRMGMITQVAVMATPRKKRTVMIIRVAVTAMQKRKRTAMMPMDTVTEERNAPTLTQPQIKTLLRVPTDIAMVVGINRAAKT